jgi:hypothetical protein
VNRVIRKMAKPPSKNNMTPEDVISFLKTLKELYDEVYNDVEQVRVIMLMFITNLPSFIGSFKFCTKSNFHRFVQKLHKFRAMVNMNNICMCSKS